jgi:hypothetical protein
MPSGTACCLYVILCFYYPVGLALKVVFEVLFLFMSMEWDDVSELQPRTGLFVPQIMSMVSDGGMILTGEDRRSPKETCPSETLPNTNPIWTGPRANPGLRSDRLPTTWTMARPFEMLICTVLWNALRMWGSLIVFVWKKKTKTKSGVLDMWRRASVGVARCNRDVQRFQNLDSLQQTPPSHLYRQV